MGGGNPVKKVTKAVTKAVDDVGNASEKSVKQSRDELGRNLGKDGQKALQYTSDLTMAAPKKFGSSTKNTSQGNIGEGLREMGEVTTGLAQLKEDIKVFKELKDGAVGSLQPVPMGTEDTNTPTPEEAAKKVADDVEMQAQLAYSKRKGRASTQLTGQQGLSGSNTYSARKTLLGA